MCVAKRVYVPRLDRTRQIVHVRSALFFYHPSTHTYPTLRPGHESPSPSRVKYSSPVTSYAEAARAGGGARC